MRWLLVAALIVMVAAPAVAQTPEVMLMPQPDGSLVVLLPAEAVKVCGDQGGCRIVTRAELEAFAAQLKKSCGTGI